MNEKVDDYGHIKFDQEEFEEKDNKNLKQKNQSMPSGPLRPLQVNLDYIHLAQGIGKQKVIGDNIPFEKIGNYSCPVCELYFKNSQSYLVHLTSPEHNQKMGMNMKVLPATDEEVLQRIQQWEEFYATGKEVPPLFHAAKEQDPSVENSN